MSDGEIIVRFDQRLRDRGFSVLSVMVVRGEGQGEHSRYVAGVNSFTYAVDMRAKCK